MTTAAGSQDGVASPVGLSSGPEAARRQCDGAARAPVIEPKPTCAGRSGAEVIDEAPSGPSRSPVFGDDPEMLVAGEAPDGTVVHIADDAAKARRDLLCPSCRMGVIAVKGALRAHHFRHRSRAACVAGAETALHLLAKRVLTEVPDLTAPPIRARLGAREEMVRPSFRMRLTDLRVEAREPGVTPDIAARAEGAPVFLEIVVTHRVDEAKRRRLADRGVSTLEIDLSKLPCSASYARIATAIRRDAPRRWVYSRRAEARLAAMRREALAEEARRTAKVAAAAADAVRHFDAAPADRVAGVVDWRRLARLGLDGLVADGPSSSVFTVAQAVWRAVVIERFLVEPCDAVAAHGALSFRAGAGYGPWRSYPVARFSVADVMAELRRRRMIASGLVGMTPEVVDAARQMRPEFQTPEVAVGRLIDDAVAATLAVDGEDWGGDRSLCASETLLGRVWRETELRAAAEIVDPALHGGEFDPGRVETWLEAVAGPEIRGAKTVGRIAPRLKALADLVRVFERSGAARRGAVPPDIRAEARKLGFCAGCL